MGIDPGARGALAIYWQDGRLMMFDMPTWWSAVKNSKKKRLRIDAYSLHQFLILARDNFDVELVVLENLGGRSNKMGSGNTSYILGYFAGLIYMGVIAVGLPIETSHPSVWKRLMNVPKDDSGIAHRFGEIFPQYRQMIRGPRGALKDGRAEAAMLAKFGHDRMLKNYQEPNLEWRMVYERAETGA